jgi:hypothetical protein
MNTSILDLSRSTDVVSIIVAGSLITLGFVIGSFVKVRNESTGAEGASITGGLEAAALALAGAVLARVFIWMLIHLLKGGNWGSALLGHLFFLIPAVVDDLLALGHSRVLTRPDGLLMLATIVGSVSGMTAGIWRIHKWKGLGLLSSLLDVTWGLAGETNGALLHLINTVWGGWGKHAKETRTGVHRYEGGFRLKNGDATTTSFAFTQGSVMSNLSDGPKDPLFSHERTHVWQNRGFGPFYSLTYIGWLIVWFFPGMIAGASTKKADGKTVGAGTGIERWCYFNCPWEVWGYAVQNADRTRVAKGSELIWSAAPVIIAGILVCGGVVAILIALFILAL